MEEWLQAGYGFVHKVMVDFAWIPRSADPAAPKAKMVVRSVTDSTVVYTYDWDERGLWTVPMPRAEFVKEYAP